MPPPLKLSQYRAVKEKRLNDLAGYFVNDEENKGVALSAELVGIKNLKMSHCWRLEFDIHEIDSHKVKELFDYIETPVALGIVGDE